MIDIAYTTNTGKLAREYTATVGDMTIDLEKVSREYLGWCTFITRTDQDHSIYHTYSQTLAEAKEKAAFFVASELIFANV